MADTTEPNLGLPSRFRIVCKLGEGAMGAVYRAYDGQMENEIALKVVLPEKAARPDIMRRVQNEIRLLHRIGGHSNVVTLHECLNLDGSGLVMVMELVDGEGLDNIIERSRNRLPAAESARLTVAASEEAVIEFLDWRTALEITLQILEGLRRIHSREIVTRDIKPANILIAREKGRAGTGPRKLIVKIADFGIAKLFGETEDDARAFTALTREGGPMPGTPGYNAPEQIDQIKFGKLGPWTDIYALGVTLFEMLTFDIPFNGPSQTDVYMGHCMTSPPLDRLDAIDAPRVVRQRLKAILGRALEKETSKRYQSAEEFQTEIREALDGTPLAQAARGGSRSSWLLIGGASASLLLIAASAYLVVLAYNRHRDKQEKQETENREVGKSPPALPAPSRETPIRSDGTNVNGGDLTSPPLENPNPPTPVPQLTLPPTQKPTEPPPVNPTSTQRPVNPTPTQRPVNPTSTQRPVNPTSTQRPVNPTGTPAGGGSGEKKKLKD